VVGYLAAETGIGQMARNILMCLKGVQFPVSGYMLKTGSEYRQQDMSAYALTARMNHFVQVFNVNADQTRVVYDLLGFDFYHNHYNIGYWFWELSDFPAVWQDSFNIYNEIWVATTFVQAAIQASTSKPVLCIPPAVSVSLPERSSRAQFGLSESDFVVLYTFDALSIIERKNPLAVIRAFELAYSEQERQSTVRLVMKVTNLAQTPEADRLRSEVKRLNGILLEGYLSRLETNALINECDLYISLHRAEGFGLTLAEAMSLGKPVVGTAYSGNTDFMTEDNSYLVPYKLVELGKDYPPYEAHHVWADPDIGVAARYLREIYDNYASAAVKGAAAAQHIQQHYSVQARGGKIAQRLRSILNQYLVQVPAPPLANLPEVSESG
jgi:glycosyltransferase involved in cell wall biosynthesis